MQERKGKNGTACRVDHNASEKSWGSNCPVAVAPWVIVGVAKFLRMGLTVSVDEFVEMNYVAAASVAVDADANADSVSRKPVKSGQSAAQIGVTSLLMVTKFAKGE